MRVPRDRSNSFTIPHPRNPNFTRRNDLLDQIYEHLKPNHLRGCTATISLCGLGGVGKSQVEIEYAYRYRGEYASICWFRANSHDQLLRDYMEVARLLVDTSRIGRERFVMAQVIK